MTRVVAFFVCRVYYKELFLRRLFSMTSILVDVVTKESFGKEQMGSVFGWTGFMSGASLLLFLYFPGLIYDLGDYIVVFSLMAGIQSLTVVAVLWFYWWQKRTASSSGSFQ